MANENLREICSVCMEQRVCVVQVCVCFVVVEERDSVADGKPRCSHFR
jgi:hypothetical protein